MKSTKYTPGPWKESNMTGETIEVWANGTPRLAIAHVTFTSLNELKANAKLIRHAPEMFDALVMVDKYFVNLQNKCALTSHDEKAWKEVSRIINSITE